MGDFNNQHIYGGNADYVEYLYEQYLSNPKTVSPSWQHYFSQLDKNHDLDINNLHLRIQESLREKSNRSNARCDDPDQLAQVQSKQTAVLRLIQAYRSQGHRQADIDPLQAEGRAEIDLLNPEFHGLTSADLDTEFYLGANLVNVKLPLRDILNMLSTTYCGSIGAEINHISNSEQKHWLRKGLESRYASNTYSRDKKLRILERLIAANSLELYLHRKYVGQKRFSLEGGTSLIPLLDAFIQRAGEQGVKEVIIGMAHRGRLNVLVNILGKSPQDLFEEFEDNVTPEFGSGDVKYHKGFSIDLKTAGGSLHTVLAFNPSHLEIINPVVEGSVRARQERRKDKDREQVVPVLIHGDAAFAGQGVVMETLNLSSTRGYTSGGTVHVVINNQIGFTTSDPLDSRSTLYCTDVAKMVQAPILHVNGDDPEAVVFVTELAFDFRKKFACDVVIDMICYRQHGHSEADEPAVTQPLMYRNIRSKASVDSLYFQQLCAENIVNESDKELMEQQYIERLSHAKPVCSETAKHEVSDYVVDYHPFRNTHWKTHADTTITRERIENIGTVLCQVPEHFTVHKTVQRILGHRKKMTQGEMNIDWGCAEMLAYGSLLQDGYPVRLSGQDSVRGTFFHRHCAIHDQNTGEIHIPLRNLAPDQPQFLPINSLLSEAAVLGYEVGYSTSEPNSLVIWEAQFGDFANGAQVIIDQFLSSSEVKWQRFCGLVMFLPHGYDGQGPEHSSARMERYLQLCAEDNLQVCNPTTPAQLFHMLRRQMLRPYRKPLIVFTPKSLLRDAMSASTIEEFTRGQFELIKLNYDESMITHARKVILCVGKIYYDLQRACNAHNITDVAIIRIEQLYPFPKEAIKAQLSKFGHVSRLYWVQEEPRNQGAWFYMQSRRNLKACILPNQTLEYIGRDYSASPAAGYYHLHIKQQEQITIQALDLEKVISDEKLKNAS